MKTVRITKSFRCVPTGHVHGREYVVGEIVDDPAVVDVALHDKCGEEIDAADAGDDRGQAEPSVNPVRPAGKAKASAGDDGEKPPVKAKKAPENK